MYVLLVLSEWRLEARGEAQELKMAATGNDHYFHFYPPDAKLSAVDFRVICILDVLDISVLKGRFIM